MAVTPTFKVELSGPFFTRDPGKTVRGNIRDMLDAVVALGATEIRRQLGGKPGARHVAPYVRGYTSSTKTGRRWGLSGAINLDTSGLGRTEAIRSKAVLYGRRRGSHGTTRGIEERWHPFRTTKNAIVRSRAVIGANLTKGIE